MWGRGPILAIALLVAPTAAAGDGYQAGAQAAQRGDYLEAARLWQALADQGHTRALVDLGFLYANGHGVERDEAKAVALYRRAADLGLALAQFNLGYMYVHGQGVERDPDRGLAWYRRAGAQGFVAAQFNLGVRYYTGEGVARDLGEAYFWFALADRGGHARAGRAREGVANSLPAADRAELDIRIAAWQPSDASALPPVAAKLPSKAAPVRASPPRATPTAVASPAAKTSAPPASHGHAPFVQLASLRSREAALREWQRILKPNRDLLGSLEPEIRRVELPERGTYYRLHAGPLPSPAAARELCGALDARKVSCLLPD